MFLSRLAVKAIHDSPGGRIPAALCLVFAFVDDWKNLVVEQQIARCITGHQTCDDVRFRAQVRIPEKQSIVG